MKKTKATNTPATDTPATDTPATDTPATNTPATDTPATDTPATDTPATDTPADQNSKPKKVRRFCLSTYIPREPLERFLKRSPWIQHYALCTHDRDTLKNGTLKGLHTHVIIYTYNPHTASGIRKNFDTLANELASKSGDLAQNTLVQECHSVISQYRYLRHLDDPDKAQYEQCEVITDNDMYWKDLCRTNGMTDSATNTGLQMFDDICEGVSTREMIIRYGKEYIYHSTHFKNVLHDHIREEKMENEWSEAMLISYFQGLLADCKIIPDDNKTNFFNVLEYLLAQSHHEQKAEMSFRFRSTERK